MAVYKRIQKELCLVAEQGVTTGVEAWQVNPELDPFVLHAAIQGPRSTPYQGGTFELEINLSSEFPLRRPRIKFVTNCFHPYVDAESGEIALSMLDEDWSPAWTLHALLLVIKTMLRSIFPSPGDDTEHDCYNPHAGKLYLDNRSVFTKTAQYWTQTMAQPVTVARLCHTLGLPATSKGEQQAWKALDLCDWDTVQAAAMLITFMDEAPEEEEEKDTGATVASSSLSVQAQLQQVSLHDDDDDDDDDETTLSDESSDHSVSNSTSSLTDNSFVVVSDWSQDFPQCSSSSFTNVNNNNDNDNDDDDDDASFVMVSTDTCRGRETSLNKM